MGLALRIAAPSWGLLAEASSGGFNPEGARHLRVLALLAIAPVSLTVFGLISLSGGIEFLRNRRREAQEHECERAAIAYMEARNSNPSAARAKGIDRTDLPNGVLRMVGRAIEDGGGHLADWTVIGAWKGGDVYAVCLTDGSQSLAYKVRHTSPNLWHHAVPLG